MAGKWADAYAREHVSLHRCRNGFVQTHRDARPYHGSAVASLQSFMGAETATTEADVHLTIIGQQRGVHAASYPFSVNLLALIFIIASDLSEFQRSTLTANLTMRGVTMQQHTWREIISLFVELLRAPKSTLDDPIVRPRNDYSGN
jgi:hypothetical protein